MIATMLIKSSVVGVSNLDHSHSLRRLLRMMLRCLRVASLCLIVLRLAGGCMKLRLGGSSKLFERLRVWKVRGGPAECYAPDTV